MAEAQELTKENYLTDKQRKVISLVLAAPSISEGCRRADISREMFYRWRAVPAFQEEFKRQRDEGIEEALHTLKASLTEATGTLIALLKADGSMGEGTRLKASLAILECVFKARELEEIEERLAALERRQQ